MLSFWLLGFKLCKYDPRLFYYLKVGKRISIIVLFVDDMLLDNID